MASSAKNGPTRRRPPAGPRPASTVAVSFDFDPDEFTVGDMEDFEDVTGRQMSDLERRYPVRDPHTGDLVLGLDGQPERTQRISAKELRALAWLIARRGDPTLSFEDAKKIKAGQIAGLRSA